MRLVLHLNCDINSALPLNYNYQLSSAIYNLLRFGSAEFSRFLHDNGFTIDGKKYKLFSFSLRFEKIELKDSHLILKSSKIKLHISSPLIDTFIQNFVIGTFENRAIEITDKDQTISFKIIFAEILPEPAFGNKMKFVLLSPMVLSTLIERSGRMQQYYLRPEDIEDINRVLTKNLLNKKGLLNRNQILSEYCKLEWDADYLAKNKRVTKKVTINENGRFPIDVIGIQAPFTIEADPELIRVGYECGFGEKNSMGFGLAEVVLN
ncbi:MAG TPA: CRISPR-associated endoribonuclease Cas6 [Ignavibacteriaceae bacterium]|nr:CRISPR-associated endoribonuclease Cas6 [Ignavibacteriaceae bacterium]